MEERIYLSLWSRALQTILAGAAQHQTEEATGAGVSKLRAHILNSCKKPKN